MYNYVYAVNITMPCYRVHEYIKSQWFSFLRCIANLQYSVMITMSKLTIKLGVERKTVVSAFLSHIQLKQLCVQT